jgi:hypothetical protein
MFKIFFSQSCRFAKLYQIVFFVCSSITTTTTWLTVMERAPLFVTSKNPRKARKMIGKRTWTISRRRSKWYVGLFIVLIPTHFHVFVCVLKLTWKVYSLGRYIYINVFIHQKTHVDHELGFACGICFHNNLYICVAHFCLSIPITILRTCWCVEALIAIACNETVI